MKNKGFTTRLVHADRILNKPQDGSVHSPTSNSVLFEFEDVNDLVAVFQGKKLGHVYSRSSSSSNAALQNMLADLEGGVAAVTFATGMAAISSMLLALLKKDDHIIVSQFLFGNTSSLMVTLQSLGIQVSYVDTTNINLITQELKENTRMVFTETIANPVTQVADLQAIGEFCETNKLLFIIDNTMTPGYIFDAKAVKASLTVTSLTKYIAGHGNVLGGAVVDTGFYDWSAYPNIFDLYRVGDPATWGMTQIRKKGLRDLGATLSPHSAQQISVGLETLALRLQRTCQNALRLATYLHGHSKVANVYYPGLADHPQHYIARELFNGNYGGVFSMDLSPGLDIHKFLNSLKTVVIATHLGDTRTLCLPVASTIFYENGAEQRAQMGINENMIRFSVGIEDIDDIVADFEQAFTKI
ncbi:cystathionine gamma-synthase family protein [Aliiglaciecola sp. NS0011-25]|uniref:cystathionine gamma-synthase family protein n=1 Tax=Aliiglaciecola sp. NS0011-25 TaxID=3127654 RepID=UPI00310514DB